jgi:hypothetical protein
MEVRNRQQNLGFGRLYVNIKGYNSPKIESELSTFLSGAACATNGKADSGIPYKGFSQLTLDSTPDAERNVLRQIRRDQERYYGDTVAVYRRNDN